MTVRAHPSAARAAQAECDQVTVVTDPASLHAMRDEWTDLLFDSARPSAFLSWEWMTTWLREYAGPGMPRVVLVREGSGRLVGLAPLYEPASGPLALRTLRFMGTGVGADHLRFLVRRGEEARVGAVLTDQALATRCDVFDFPRMDEEAARSLQGAASHSGGFGCGATVADVCPFIPLPATWEEYLRALSANARKDLGRRWRRLRECGEVAIQRVDAGPELDEAWDVLLRLHLSRQREVGSRSAFATPHSLAFHRAFLQTAAERGWLRLYLMRVGAEYVAAEYCVSIGDRFEDLQTGFDAKWSRYGVGTLIVAHAIQDAVVGGAIEFDFLRGGEEYKQQRWGASLRQDVSLVIWKRRPPVAARVAVRRWATDLKVRIRRALAV